MDTVASHLQCLPKVSFGQPLSNIRIQRRHALGKKRVPLRRRIVRHHAVRIHSQAGFGRGTVKIKEEEEEPETAESEPTSGTKKFFKLPMPINKLPGTVKLQNKSQSQAKSNKVVFVAGATGKVGSRTVRELLKLGFNVRASTRNSEKAQALFEDVASSSAGIAGSDDAAPFGLFSVPAKLFGFLKPKPGKSLEIVECNLEDSESIELALGNAGVVVCCIGASEKEVLDVTGPYRIDFKATENLINAASSAEVSHFVLLTSLGTQKFGFPAAVLNLFWGVLLWKAKAEKALIQSGLPYTIVRPGGMERPTDAYKETHNLILAEQNKLFGGQVSNLQVAELLASIVENPNVSVNKIIEAVAETTAPLRPIEELLEEIPASETSGPSSQNITKSKPRKADVDAKKPSKEQEEEKSAGNARALALMERESKRNQAQKEKEEKRIQAERDEKEKQRLQALRKKYEEEIEVAREKEDAAKSAAAAALAEKAELENRAAEIRAKAEAAALAASQAKAVEAAVLAAARKRNVLSDEEKEKIMESVRLARLPKEAAAPAEQPKPSLKKKKPAFSFLGRAAPLSTTTESTTETEQSKEADKEEESKAKPKADKEPVADKKQEGKKLKEEQEAKNLAEAKQNEEQETLEKVAKERAEREVVEAKLKEEAEAKRKEEELAEAKKEEEEEKVKKEAEAKRKEEEELAEAKKKEEEAKEEEQEKAKKEAETLTAEAEEKAKALAEEQATISAATDEEVKEEEPKEAEAPAPRRKGFRWFWQPAEPETPEVEESTDEQVSDVPVEAKAQVAEVAIEAKEVEQLPKYPTPLSPYTRYPGLKPPARPIASTPTPMAEKVATPEADPVSSSTEVNSVDQMTPKVGLPPQEDPAVVTEEPSKESEDDIEERTQKIQEVAAREKEALEKAQATIAFKWLWQKPETTVEEPTSVSNEEVPAAPQEPASSIKEQEAVSPAIQSQEKTSTLPPSSRPLSPYAQFPNLKPPSPPKTSSAPQKGSARNLKLAETLPSSSSPLSPYLGFPDLKPPGSPAPLAQNGAVPADEEKEAEKTPEPAASSGFKWPWQQ